MTTQPIRLMTHIEEPRAIKGWVVMMAVQAIMLFGSETWVRSFKYELYKKYTTSGSRHNLMGLLNRIRSRGTSGKIYFCVSMNLIVVVKKLIFRRRTEARR